jgi:nucleoside-diphosphate-sugar epimerase
MVHPPLNNVLVTGGAGYVGSALVPKLLAAGHSVTVIDLFIYGEAALAGVAGHPRLTLLKGDIRDQAFLIRALANQDAVIHLACISNDPSFELDPALGKSINYDAFIELVRLAKDFGVRRFVYASSSSVYGLKSDPRVTEDLPLAPLTDYSKYKAMCEEVLDRARSKDFVTLTFRPATVCGYAPRLRLDLVVNILTNHAINNGKITVFGGDQMRPNIHIDDMTDLYVESLTFPDDQIDGKVFNAGFDNHRVRDLAEIVRDSVGRRIEIAVAPTDDNRSYHVCSDKISRELGFRPKKTIEAAVRDLAAAFRDGHVPNAMTDPRYYNIRMMQQLGLG